VHDSAEIRLDLTFLEISVELDALEEFWRTWERGLPDLIKTEEERLCQKWSITDDPGGGDEEIWRAMHTLLNNDLPRMFRSGVLVLLWAIFESAVTKAADALKAHGKHGLSVRDIRGDNDLDAMKKYFENVLKFPLFKTDDEREKVEMLRILRNTISHWNGRIEESFQKKRPGYWKKLESWQKLGIGISFEYFYLEFTPAFIESILLSVSNSVRDLLDRVVAACAITRRTET
jgi:hypothetical protein